MDKNIEKICEKIGFGIAISIIISIILFFNINETAFGEIILYEGVTEYKISENINDMFEEAEPVANVDNKSTEIIGIDDITFEENEENSSTDNSVANTMVNALDLDKFQDINNLRQQFYIIDSSTGMPEEYFDINKFMSTDIKIEKNSQEPQVLIFHSHPHEMFIDSVGDDLSEGIVGAGDKLASFLEGYGINVLHFVDESFDMENGSIERSQSYERMEPVIQKVLAENPSIELVIDLHRDGVAENTHLVQNINGKQTAKIMFFNGMSMLMENGVLNPISYLPNPYLDTNLALSFNMELAAQSKYPGFTRKIYIKSYRYSLHLKPKTMLVEAGAQTNTKQEIYNAMELLAELINDVIFS